MFHWAGVQKSVADALSRPPISTDTCARDLAVFCGQHIPVDDELVSRAQIAITVAAVTMAESSC